MMMWWLAACGWLGGGSPPPPDLPEGAAHITVRSEGFLVDGEPVVPFAILEIDPVDAVDEHLKAALAGRSAAWMDLPADQAWYRARKLFGSARAAGVEQVWVSAGGAAVQEGATSAIGLRMSCADGPVAWSGVRPRITLAIQRSGDGTWALATARFLPVVDGVPTDGLPATCLAEATCAGLYDGSLQEACEAGRRGEAQSRVTLGDEVGCLLPLVRQEGDLSMWKDDLPRVLRRLGFQQGYPVVLSPEARVRVDAVVTVMQAFSDADIAVPSLGQPLIEGNDGAPLCQAEVRDAHGLADAAARYAGSLMGPTEE